MRVALFYETKTDDLLVTVNTASTQGKLGVMTYHGDAHRLQLAGLLKEMIRHNINRCGRRSRKTRQDVFGFRIRMMRSDRVWQVTESARTEKKPCIIVQSQ